MPTELGAEILIGDYVLELISDGCLEFSDFYCFVEKAVDRDGHDVLEVNHEGVTLFSGEWAQVVEFIEALDPTEIDYD